MNFANPYYFAAILDHVTHRFVLVQECESIIGNDGFSPPRFSVGAVNATRDPRFSSIKQLMEVGVTDSALQIPATWLMVHQYIYIIHDNTDEFGWQYRSQWSALGVPNPKEEPWSKEYMPNSKVRRRIWMTTIVARQDLVRAKRLLAENLRTDLGNVKLQGELLRYEKAALLSKPWQRRKVVLLHNRLEVYTAPSKKTDIPLQDCEVKMLFEQQAPAGGKCVFSIRHPTGSVGVLFDAEDQETRRAWVLAIQYQLAVNSYEVNFVPFEYAPPTGTYPDNRVVISGDLKLQGQRASEMYGRNFQLLPREMVYYEGESLKGRIFVEQAMVSGEDRNLNFTVTSTSGIKFNLAAENAEAKNLWLIGIRRQVQVIENYKLREKTYPREELDDSEIPVIDRISQFYDEAWTAPAVAGEDEDYLQKIFTAPYENNPDHFEFSEELGINLDPKIKKNPQQPKKALGRNPSATQMMLQPSAPTPPLQSVEVHHVSEVVIPTMHEVKEISFTDFKKTPEISEFTRSEMTSVMERTLSTVSTTTSATTAVSAVQRIESEKREIVVRQPTLMKGKSTAGLFQPAVKLLDAKRNLINPRFMLSSLKGVTHRFVLVLECENRLSAPKDIQDKAPQRFTVGGPRASKDPRAIPQNQLIAISNKNPEVQLPAGWFMLHQYIYIIQQNTDDDGWQYRSTWSDGTLTAADEQWVDTFDETKFVRRRMWMTTVVRKEDMLRAKKMVCEELSKTNGDAILTENLYLYNNDAASSSTSWQRRKVLLYHNKLEFYSGNDKTGEANLADCEVKILTGKDTMGRDFPFQIVHPSGSVMVLLDAENAAMRLRWVRAILYQLAIITPDVSFEPWLFGPPTGEVPQSRLLLCGELDVLDSTGTWVPYQAQLRERALLIYQRDTLRGRLLLDQATLKAREDETEFTFRTGTGLLVHFRAASPDAKFAWVRALKRQAQFMEYVRAKGRPIDSDPGARRTSLRHYYDEDWVANEVEHLEDDDYYREMLANYEVTLAHMWPEDSGTMREVLEKKHNSKDVARDHSADLAMLRATVPDLSRYAETDTDSTVDVLQQHRSDRLQQQHLATATALHSAQSFSTSSTQENHHFQESRTETKSESRTFVSSMTTTSATKTETRSERTINKSSTVASSNASGSTVLMSNPMLSRALPPLPPNVAAETTAVSPPPARIPSSEGSSPIDRNLLARVGFKELPYQEAPADQPPEKIVSLDSAMDSQDGYAAKPEDMEEEYSDSSDDDEEDDNEFDADGSPPQSQPQKSRPPLSKSSSQEKAKQTPKSPQNKSGSLGKVSLRPTKVNAHKLQSSSTEDGGPSGGGVGVSRGTMKPIKLTNMSESYLMRKGYLQPGQDHAKIPMADLRKADQLLVQQSGFLIESGNLAIIPMKSEEERAKHLATNSDEAELRISSEDKADTKPGKLNRTLQKSTSVAKTAHTKTGLVPQLAPGESMTKDRLRHVESWRVDKRHKVVKNDFSWSPLQLGLVKLRSVKEYGQSNLATDSGNASEQNEEAAPFRMVKLRSVSKRQAGLEADGGGEGTDGEPSTLTAASLDEDDRKKETDQSTPIMSLQELRSRNQRHASIKDRIELFEEASQQQKDKSMQRPALVKSTTMRGSANTGNAPQMQNPSSKGEK